jgi:hypothetical protein
MKVEKNQDPIAKVNIPRINAMMFLPFNRAICLVLSYLG